MKQIQKENMLPIYKIISSIRMFITPTDELQAFLQQ